MSQRRSDEPIYWLTFGFGGMVAGFALPAIILCMLIAGFTDGKTAFHFSELITHWWGAGAVAVIVCACLWHAFHRIYHTLHDFTIHTTRLHHYALYGAAGALSVTVVVLLFLNYIKPFLN